MLQIVLMCNAFVARGHSVELSVTNRPTSIDEDPQSYYGIPLLFTISRISVPDIAGNDAHIPAILRSLAYTLQRFIFAVHAGRHIRKGSYDMVYGRDEWVLWFISFLVSTKLIWESHEARFTFATRRIIQHSQKFVVISEGIREFYEEQGVERSKMVVAHDAVDERFFAPHSTMVKARERLGMSGEKPVVMYIGGLEDWKGPQVLFEASRNQSVYDVYVIGGNEDELSRYRKEYPHVHFLGLRPYKELPDNQQAADILVVTNTRANKNSSHYTSPLKLFAYMSSKKPIVVPNVPSVTNIIKDDEAYFYEPDMPASLHEQIIAILKNPVSALKTAEKLYSKSGTFTWQERAKRIIAFISDVADGDTIHHT